MDGTFDDLHEPQRSDSIPEANQLVAEHETWKGGPLQEANAKYDELNGLVHQMAELGSTDNPYTTLTPEVWSDRIIPTFTVHTLFVSISLSLPFSLPLSLLECV